MDNFRSGSTPQTGAYAPKPAAPQPGRPVNRSRPPTPVEPAATSRSNGRKDGINLAALSKLHNILKDYPDEGTLTAQQQSELKSRLRSAGLTRPGTVVHVIA